MFTNLDVILSTQIQHFLKDLDRVALGVSIFEIFTLAFLLYYLYQRFIKNTQSENLVRGCIWLVVMWGLSEFLIRINLNIFGVFLQTLVSIVAIALIVIFQPELRRFLGYIGQGNLFEKIFTNDSNFTNEKKTDVARELIEALKYMSKSKTGGLIVLQKEMNSVSQSDIGVKLNADVSQELLLTIFFPKTPLHDGAVVIHEDKIISAGVLLPLTDNPKLSWRYGTRHRAAIGVSETYPDCACIVVSEETGDVSVAIDGTLKKYDDLGKLKSDLMRILGYKSADRVHVKSFIKFDNIFASQEPKNNKQAFTLTEIIIATVLVAFMATVTLVSTMSSIGLDKKKAVLQSQNFYNLLNNSYISITTDYLDPFKLASSDEEVLLNRLGGALKIVSLNEDCSKLKVNDLKCNKCAKTATGMKIGVKIDNKCSASVEAYEYLRKEDAQKPISERTTRQVENACGYLVYTLKKSENVFKQDAFVIPLKKRNLG